ncbi:DUF7519 family protein [Halobellus clavatus]|jgi:hypothetical protein|uniref:Uncharacterized protein n=1 Tax=Halobellus clavatus TaxID=660517 RepID=A0A1H3CZN6_9EURY|nr:hypothetical protein [Halobellus clavatus]SDX59004.1 hypothetical protein SAMN04487946_101258 [Halobellus clavatus]
MTRQRVTARPPTFAASLALLAGFASVLALAVGSFGALAAGTAGAVLLAGGLYAASRRVVAFAGGAFLLGILVAGARGAAAEPLLLAALGAVLAWDLGAFAVGVGEQLGREADTARLTIVHAASGLLVGVVGAGVLYGVFLGTQGGQPASAVASLLVGVVILVAVLRR